MVYRNGYRIFNLGLWDLRQRAEKIFVGKEILFNLILDVKSYKMVFDIFGRKDVLKICNYFYFYFGWFGV